MPNRAFCGALLPLWGNYEAAGPLMDVRLTDRDIRLLAKCAICRWLTTQQIRRLYFPRATLNAVQKRLRKLSETGYLRSYQEHPTAEAVHTVGPKGKPLLAGREIEVVLGGEVPAHLAHLLGVNEIRIAVETSGVRVAYFFAYWQLSDLGWKYTVIPDAVFAVHSPARRTFLVEYDRSTETLGKLLEKLRWYGSRVADFQSEAVLIVTERTRQLDFLAREIRKKKPPMKVLVSTLDSIAETGFLSSDFIEVPSGERTKLLVLPENEDESKVSSQNLLR